jgi:hypothetical protein
MLMSFAHAADGPIVLVGGSGVVGRALAPLLGRLESREIVVAGRTEANAAPVIESVRTLGRDARFASYAIGEESSNRLPASVVVGLVNDPADHLLQAAYSAGVPSVDITRWTTRMVGAWGRISLARPKSAVVFSSGWMAGLVARAAAALTYELAEPVSDVQGAIRYALSDASGADSVEYMDRLWVPFDVWDQGRPKTVMPFTEKRKVSIAGQSTVVRRFDTPEQFTLPLTLAAETVAVRMGFDSGVAGAVLAALVRVGFFRWFCADRFSKLRHAVLRTPGAEHRSGARASFRVDVRGRSGSTRSVSLSSEAGQAALTAVGTWLSVRWLLHESTLTGAHFPEQDTANRSLWDLISRAGVQMSRESVGS